MIGDMPKANLHTGRACKSLCGGGSDKKPGTADADPGTEFSAENLMAMTRSLLQSPQSARILRTTSVMESTPTG